MKQPEIQELLARGIEAAKVGQQVKARDLLLKVVEEEPEHEQAWLWLSGVVNDDDDRRICLENVLVLNPDNKRARLGLDKLEESPKIDEPDVPPKRYVDSTIVSPVPPVTQKSQSFISKEYFSIDVHGRPDDIWELDVRMCAYCAEQIENATRKCPACGRKLMIESYRYSKPSVDLTIYWVLLIGVVQLYLVQILIRLLVEGDWQITIWQGLVVVILVVIILGVMFRRFWAYIASILTLLLIGTAMLFDWYTSVGPEEILEAKIKANFIQAVAANPYLTLGSPLLKFIRPLHFGAVVLALLYGLFKVAPDFERVKLQLAAAVQRGLSAPIEFFHAGREYASRGMWASAVLHWRRAAALEPTRLLYLRHLGDAYGRVGDYERSLNVLESAVKIAREPEEKREIEELISRYEAGGQPGSKAAR